MLSRVLLLKRYSWILIGDKVDDRFHPYQVRRKKRTGRASAVVQQEALFWLTLTYHILGEPDPAVGIGVNADPDTVERCAGQVDVVPAGGAFIHHAFLDGVYMCPGRIGRTGKTDAFTTIGEGEAFSGDAYALAYPIGAGVTEAAVEHVPAVQARASCEGVVPGERIKVAHGSVVVDQGEKLLSQLYLFRSHGGGLTIGCVPRAGARNIRGWSAPGSFC